MPPPPSDPQVDGALPIHAPADALDAASIDGAAVAQEWLSSFGTACEQNNVSGLIDLIWEDGMWCVLSGIRANPR